MTEIISRMTKTIAGKTVAWGYSDRIRTLDSFLDEWGTERAEVLDDGALWIIEAVPARVWRARLAAGEYMGIEGISW